MGDQCEVAFGGDDLPMIGCEVAVKGVAAHDAVGIHTGEVGEAFLGVLVDPEIVLSGEREDDIALRTGGADELLEVEFEAVGAGAADEDFGRFFVEEGGEGGGEIPQGGLATEGVIAGATEGDDCDPSGDGWHGERECAAWICPECTEANGKAGQEREDVGGKF